MAAIDERVPSCGDLKWSRNINIAIKRSSNHGLDWTEAEVIIDFPDGQSASDPSMIVDLETDEILMFYNFMDLDKEKDIYYLHVIKSKDNGRSWSEPEDITDQITKPEWKKDFKFITSGRGYQTQDGSLYNMLVNLEYGVFVFGSKDHGKSWFLVDTPIKPADESKFIELADGKWMINSRVEGPKLRYIHISDDDGESWTSRPDSTLVDPNCNASIIKHPERDILLFSNAASTDARENLTVKVSFDHGMTWTREKIIYPGPTAYSSMTLMDNGNIGILFEKDGYKENVFVSIKLDWLLSER